MDSPSLFSLDAWTILESVHQVSIYNLDKLGKQYRQEKRELRKATHLVSADLQSVREVLLPIFQY